MQRLVTARDRVTRRLRRTFSLQHLDNTQTLVRFLQVRSRNCRQRHCCVCFFPNLFPAGSQQREQITMPDNNSTVFLFKGKNKLVLPCQILGWKIIIYLPTNFPIMTANIQLPSLAQLVRAALLCATWQAAPFSTEKPAFQKLVNELLLTFPAVCSDIIIRDEKHPPKSRYALQNMYLPDPNELWEGSILNAIHQSVNCNSRMHLVLAGKT